MSDKNFVCEPFIVLYFLCVKLKRPCFCYRWLVQFGIGSREDIVCSKDGTRRQGEPSAEENLSCVVVFVLVSIISWNLALKINISLESCGSGMIDERETHS